MTRDQIGKAWSALRSTGLDPKSWVLVGRKPVAYPGRRGARSLRALRFYRSIHSYSYQFRHRTTGKRLDIPGGWSK